MNEEVRKEGGEKLADHELFAAEIHAKECGHPPPLWIWLAIQRGGLASRAYQSEA